MSRKTIVLEISGVHDTSNDAGELVEFMSAFNDVFITIAIAMELDILSINHAFTPADQADMIGQLSTCILLGEATTTLYDVADYIRKKLNRQIEDAIVGVGKISIAFRYA